MTTTLDVTIEALLQTLERLTTSIAGNEVKVRSGVHSFVSGVPAPTFNVVWLDRLVDQAYLSIALSELETKNLPYCVEYYEERDHVVDELRKHDVMREHDLPLMALESLDALPSPGQTGALKIRRLRPDEASLHTAVAASGFGMEESLFRPMVPADTLKLEGVSCYIGESEGQAVTTALAVATGSHVGILNVATLVEHRGLGYARSVTLQALEDAHRAGASSAWLQSSPMAYSMYQKLGFETLVELGFWIRA